MSFTATTRCGIPPPTGIVTIDIPSTVETTQKTTIITKTVGTQGKSYKTCMAFVYGIYVRKFIIGIHAVNILYFYFSIAKGISLSALFIKAFYLTYL